MWSIEGRISTLNISHDDRRVGWFSHGGLRLPDLPMSLWLELWLAAWLPPYG
jgi:hypothetical protein